MDWDGVGFILNADSVVFFNQTDPDYVEGQRLLASIIMSPEFQIAFNKVKGSVPVRTDLEVDELDDTSRGSGGFGSTGR